MGNDYMKDVNTFNLEKLKKDLDEAIAGLDEVGSKQDAAAAQLLEHQISNVKALYDAEIKYLNKSKEFRLKNEQEINEKLISLGYDAQQVLAAKSRKDKEQEIKDEYAAKLQAEKDPAKKKLLRQQRKEALNEAKKNETELDKLKTKLRKQQNKEYGKELQNAVKTA